MAFLEEDYDPWASEIIEDYIAEKNDRGYFDIEELNRFLKIEKLVMEKDYEQWIDDTYSAAGR